MYRKNRELDERLKAILEAIETKRKKKQIHELTITETKPIPIYELSSDQLLQLYRKYYGNQSYCREHSLSKEELETKIKKCVNCIIKSCNR